LEVAKSQGTEGRPGDRKALARLPVLNLLFLPQSASRTKNPWARIFLPKNAPCPGRARGKEAHGFLSLSANLILRDDVRVLGAHYLISCSAISPGRFPRRGEVLFNCHMALTPPLEEMEHDRMLTCSAGSASSLFMTMRRSRNFWGPWGVQLHVAGDRQDQARLRLRAGRFVCLHPGVDFFRPSFYLLP
jgi:hypothetical protein